MTGPATRLAAALLLACAAVPACISVGGGGGKPQEQRSFDLQPPLPAETPPEAEGPEVLWVEPFTADAALDRDEIVWRRGAVESGAYERYRWVRPPAEAVRAIVADAVSRAGLCAVAASDPRVGKPDFTLKGHLARFEEVDDGGAWSGTVEVRIALVRVEDGEEILRRTYARAERAGARNPGGVVEALKKALDSVASAVVGDVGKALRRERARGPGWHHDPTDPPPPDASGASPVPPKEAEPTPVPPKDAE